MARIDLHVHSSFSSRASEWFLQRLGTRESYVEPAEVMQRAQERGMDFVTITDHNTVDGALLLQSIYPGRVLTGVEATSYFPLSGTKVHILVYGLSESQFTEINQVRSDIFALREYLLQEHLAHAVAHATFTINRPLAVEDIERLILLFDCFEGINGQRARYANEGLVRVLTSLTPDRLSDLYTRHRIEPASDRPWVKGLIGGSDDHSGMFIGATYTEVDAATPGEVAQRILQRATSPAGRHTDYRRLALAIYKVAYDFSRSRGEGLAGSLFQSINSLLFEGKSQSFRERITVGKVKWAASIKNAPMRKLVAELMEELQMPESANMDRKLELIDTTLSKLADEFFRLFVAPLGEKLANGDVVGVVKNISGALPGLFLALPYFTVLPVLHGSRELTRELEARFVGSTPARKKRVLWFTDTLTDLNGVSATLTRLATLARDRGLDLRLVGIPAAGSDPSTLPPNLISLPCIHSYTPSFFQTYTLRLPSLLNTLRLVCDAEPDEIYISTPGPVGVAGLILAKLLQVPSVAVYHTDFARQTRQIIGDDTVCALVEEGIRQFYSRADRVAVPSEEYMSILEHRGISRQRMVRFRRGIETQLFSPHHRTQGVLARLLGIREGITFVYAGRISKEKNLDFLMEVFAAVWAVCPEVNLVLAGDGPDLEAMKEEHAHHRGVCFAGRLPRADLPAVYANSHALVFPSITDTFGMVVLESQSCGTPAIVSDFGGPQEIIVNGKTGYVARANDTADWTKKILGLVELVDSYPALYQEMRESARLHIVKTYDWDNVLADIFQPPTMSARSSSPRVHRAYEDIVAINRQ